MKHFVVMLDARPRYAGHGAASLLQVPLGGGTLLSHLTSEAKLGFGSCELFAIPCAPMGRGYAQAMAHVPGVDDPVQLVESLRPVVDRTEPSDVLVVIDARCALLDAYPWKELIRGAAAARGAAHLIAVEDGSDRAQENAWYDENGDVQRVERYYAGVTLVRAQTVFCTLMSGAAARLIADEPLESARQLRQSLTSADVASRDVLTSIPWLNMEQERGALSLACRRLISLESGADKFAARDLHNVHRAARLSGPIEIQSDATIDAGATIIGPAILGAGCRVMRGATVARAIIGPGVTVRPGVTLAQQIMLADEHFDEERAADEQSAQNFEGLRRAYATARHGAQQKARPRPRAFYPEIKALIEGVIAAVALLMLSPLFFLTAIAIKYDSPGSVFFAHKREGRNGKRFRCWKFRTMEQDADAQQRALYRQNPIDGPQFKLKADPRVTRVGRVLRDTNIDELPQLLNVLLGQMSLIGPRPSPFRENQVCVEWREARLSVRPGITGLWQVCRSNRDSSDFHQWISYDIAYVRHMSPLLDLRIIWATIVTLGGRKAVALERVIPGYHDHFVAHWPQSGEIPILATWPEAGEAACR